MYLQFVNVCMSRNVVILEPRCGRLEDTTRTVHTHPHYAHYTQQCTHTCTIITWNTSQTQVFKYGTCPNIALICDEMLLYWIIHVTLGELIFE